MLLHVASMYYNIATLGTSEHSRKSEVLMYSVLKCGFVIDICKSITFKSPCILTNFFIDQLLQPVYHVVILHNNQCFTNISSAAKVLVRIHFIYLAKIKGIPSYLSKSR